MGNPVWAKDYFINDPENVPRNVKRLQDLVLNNPKMMVRPDVRVLAQYMNRRDTLMSVLAARDAAGGSADLTAKSNQDIAMMWQNFQEDMKESNTVFGRLFWRFLSNDKLQASKIGD